MRIVVTQSDLEQIEALIEDFLNSFHPDIDYSRGTPQNDLVVQGFKVPLALLQAISNRFYKTRSLAGIQELLDSIDAADPTEPDVIDAQAEISSAVQEVLSNWFNGIQGGRRSRGLVTLHLSSNETFVLPGDWRAFRTLDLPFINVRETDTLITASDLTPVVDSEGTVLEYTYRALLEAETEGDIGDVTPGVWESFDQISPFLFRVSSDFTFVGGADDESAQDAIDRVADAGVHERSLLNQRSVNARFDEDYPEFLPVRVIRAGDPEMQRDLLLLGGTFEMHQLNKYNIYTGGNIAESQLYTNTLGGAWANPRTNDIIQGEPHRMILPFSPVLFIREIRFNNTAGDPSLAPFTDSDGYVRFDLLSRYSLAANGDRIETPYTNLNQAKLIPTDDEEAYLYWGSAKQTMFLEINPQTFTLSQPQIEIIYDTVEGFSTVHTLFESSDERPGAGEPLAYSYYPAVMRFTLEYIRRTDILDGLAVDVAEAKRLLTTFIRSQKQGNPLFAQAIQQEFMDNFGDIAAGVKPLTLSYFAILPDGSRIDFETTDRVSFDLQFLKSASYTPKNARNEDVSLNRFQYSDRTLIAYTDEVNIQVREATT